ncbi:ATPase P [Lutibacter sp. HS1-25]|uniref:HAD family hydrolase n=1 Tax=Lutibacter sp. HS1-25 TaxID=2485000 RepID=UPI00101058FA|nr:HAD family hydrolase [Lutibacter sp. HS1-25]RXP63329.1 ATPase P [Lutibacter sp. HS1-25]
MTIDIPGYKKIEIKNLLCDFNGTIANNGELIYDMDLLINKLSKSIKIYVITADTFDTVENQLKHLNCEIIKISSENQSEQKLAILKELNPLNTVAFGNGRNDQLMLKEAIVGVGILENEGICTSTLINADIICKNIHNAFELLLTPKKLIATLRN